MATVFAGIPQAKYFPYLSGKYEVKPGLRPFGFDFGNGEMDQRVFQCDQNYARYYLTKCNAVARHSKWHVLTHNCPREVMDKVLGFISDRLTLEYPDLFRSSSGFADMWESIGLNVQEDLAISVVDEEKDWLAAIHVCLPAPWDPEEKVGKSFKALHEPVPGMEQIAAKGPGFAKLMVQATDGIVRFVWGFASDDSLNKHPRYCPQPKFSREARSCFVRVERQGIWGFPDVNASLFTIRPYFYDMFELIKDEIHREALRSVVAGFSADEVEYKLGGESAREILLEWLS